MSTCLRWGLLSTARINLKIIAASASSDCADVVAVASRDGKRAAEYALQQSIPRWHESYDALLADPDLDAVYVSLPNHLHVEWSRRALEAGKHVLCEKPLSRSPTEVVRAFDIASERGLVLSEAFMWRHHPQTDKLVDLVQNGAIGSLRRIRCAFGYDLGAGWSTRRGVAAMFANSRRRFARLSQRDIRLVGAYDGGALMDLGTYCVNAIRLLAGEPLTVDGRREVGPSDIDVYFTGRLELAGDVRGEFECGLAMERKSELEVVGTAGSLFLADPFSCAHPGIEVRRDSVERIAVPSADAYRLELENVAHAVIDRSKLLLGRADALGQSIALEALLRSAHEEQSVRVTEAAGGASTLDA